jgi:hypothetical protein
VVSTHPEVEERATEVSDDVLEPLPHRFWRPIGTQRTLQIVLGLFWLLDAGLLHDVVADLNPVLRGWGAYFRYANSSQAFAAIDEYVYWWTTKLARVKYATRGRLRTTRFTYVWCTISAGIDSPETSALGR